MTKINDSNFPPKIKVLLWLLLKNSVLTKDNLLKREWTSSKARP